jgi:hypothetical protein
MRGVYISEDNIPTRRRSDRQLKLSKVDVMTYLI